jgi:hypothetical protein
MYKHNLTEQKKECPHRQRYRRYPHAAALACALGEGTRDVSNPIVFSRGKMKEKGIKKIR